MRSILAGLAVICSCATLLAVGGKEEKPHGKPLDSNQAQKFALTLYRTTNLIIEQYVRPVSRIDLMSAGLRGLYEMGRAAVPSTLDKDLQEAVTPEKMLTLVQQLRERLGDPEPLRDPNDLLVSLRAMSKALDPYSGPIATTDLNGADGGDLSPGIGLEVIDNLGVGPLVVKTVSPGGPAQKAGVRPGDRITHINGGVVDGSPTATQQLRGGTPIAQASAQTFRVLLTIQRAAQATPINVSIEAESFRGETVLGVMRQENNQWDYLLDRKNRIAHVRIAQLARGTGDELAQALSILHAQGTRGLILDLRWCPGGFLNEAVIIAQLFVGSARVATVKSRDGRTNEYNSTRERRFDMPLLVLVNGETSGGAELIAAALQDNQRGMIAGQRTLGKASVQTTFRLPVPEMEMKLTSGTFIRPNGKNLHRFPDSKLVDDWGVLPDPELEFRVSTMLSRQLREWWLLQTLRPGGAKEVLPLDDPARDPQRQEALQALARKVMLAAQ